MNQSLVLRQKMRAALLSTTGLCATGLLLPSVAAAAPNLSRISNGEVAQVGQYILEHDVTVENEGSRLIGHMIAVIDGYQFTVDDNAQADLIYLQIGGDAVGGSVVASNGGKIYVEGNMEVGSPFSSIGYGTVTVAGAGSLLDVAGDLTLYASASYVFGSGLIQVRDGGTLNAGTIFVDTAGGVYAHLVIGSNEWNAPAAPGQLNADLIVLSRRSQLGFNHTGRFEYSGELRGTGNLYAEAGHTILSGDSALFEGSTSYMSGGTLEVNGRLGGTVYLGHGNLTGTGSVDSMVLNPALAGTIRPQGSAPTIGRLDIGVYSTLYVEVDPDGDKSVTLNVTGRATIGEGTELHHIEGAKSNFRRSSSYVLINAAGGLEGEFETVRTDYAFLDASMDYTDTQAILNLDRNDIRFTDIAGTANQFAVAEAIEGINQNLNLSDLVIDLSEEDGRLAFTQMAGELHASGRTAMMLDAVALRQTLIGSIEANHGSTQPYGVWGRALASGSTLNGRDQNAELKSDATGFVAGIDKAFGTAMRAGVMVGFEQAEMKSKDLGEIYRNTQHLGVYGRGDWGQFNVQTGAIASWHSLSSQRDLAFGTQAQSLKSDYDATSAQAYVEAAYSVPMAWATVSPYASLAFNTLDVDGVGEQGGVAALDVFSSKQDLTTAALGLAARKTWVRDNGRSANVSARLGWESYSGDLDAVQNVAFADSADFEIVGLSMGDDAVVASVGVAMPVGKAGTVSLDWNGLKGSDQSRNAMAVSYRLSF